MKTRFTALGLGVLMAASAAWARHAVAAEFDANKPVTLRGTVTKMECINPHSWIHIAVKDEQSGEVKEWMIDCGPPNGLLRRGFTKDSLKEGTALVVLGWRAKDDSFRANGSEIRLSDGSREFLGTSNKDYTEK